MQCRTAGPTRLPSLLPVPRPQPLCRNHWIFSPQMQAFPWYAACCCWPWNKGPRPQEGATCGDAVLPRGFVVLEYSLPWGAACPWGGRPLTYLLNTHFEEVAMWSEEQGGREATAIAQLGWVGLCVWQGRALYAEPPVLILRGLRVMAPTGPKCFPCQRQGLSFQFHPICVCSKCRRFDIGFNYDRKTCLNWMSHFSLSPSDQGVAEHIGLMWYFLSKMLPDACFCCVSFAWQGFLCVLHCFVYKPATDP